MFWYWAYEGRGGRDGKWLGGAGIKAPVKERYCRGATGTYMSESKAPPGDDCLPVSSPSSSVAGEGAADAGMMMMGTATFPAPHCHSLSASLISTAANCERDAVKPASDMEEGKSRRRIPGRRQRATWPRELAPRRATVASFP